MMYRNFCGEALVLCPREFGGWHSLLVKLCSFQIPCNTVCKQTVPPVILYGTEY